MRIRFTAHHVPHTLRANLGVVRWAGLLSIYSSFPASSSTKMATSIRQSVGVVSEIRSNFNTKEGHYRRVNAFEHCRPSRQPLFGKELSPVQISLVSCKGKDGLQEWIVFNSSKELYFYPFEGIGRVPDLKHPFDKRVYKVPTIPVCHDFNIMTRSTEHLDLVVGFSTGPLQFLNPLEKQAVCAFNEDGSVDSTRVSAIKWVPGSEHQFVSSHRSGNLYVWTTEGHATSKVYIPQNYVLHKEPLDAKIYSIKQRHKSPLLFRWSIGHGSINSFAFSPDSIHLAIVSQDGFLRVYNFREQTLYGRMRSYFGGLLCVCWSPDGKYAVTGGEDDLITVWSFDHKRVVARGDGHKSYVTAVAFDPYMTILPSTPNSPTTTCVVSPTSVQAQAETSLVAQSPEGMEASVKGSTITSPTVANATLSSITTGKHVLDKNPTSSSYTAYRLGSIGQDTQLCLWDLSGDSLNTRRLNRGRSRITKHYSSRPVSMGDPGSDLSPTGVMESSELGRITKDTEEKHNSKETEEVEKRLDKDASPAHNHLGSDYQEGKLATNSLLAADHHRKESSPSISVSSTSSVGSKKEKKKKKDKDKKKALKPNRHTLKEPMRKVIKFVGSGFSTSNQSNIHGRGQMGNFETCCSDDIAPKMHEVNHVEPLVAEKISQERLSALVFREDCFLTACQEGFVHTWARPNVCMEEVNVVEEEEREGRRGDDACEHRPSYSNPTSNNSGINSPKPSSASDHEVPVKTTSM